MGQEDEGRHSSFDSEVLAKRLEKTTGISIDEARELIRLLGPNWTSLVREAVLLKKRR